MRRCAQLSVVALLAVSGCASVPETDTTAGAVSDSVTSLEGGLDELVARFNADADKPRIVALLSPT
jgi:hypothetical protein